MTLRLNRRSLLQSGAAVAALPATWPAWAQEQRRFEPQVGGWRTFEVTTTVTVGALTPAGNSAYSMRTPRAGSDTMRAMPALPVHTLSSDC